MLNPAEAKSIYENDVHEILTGTDYYEYNFLLFQRNPLIELTDGLYFPIDLGYFSNKLKEGIYWILHDYYKKKDEKLFRELSKFRGELHENYVCSIIETTFNKSIKLTESNEPGAKQADLICILSNRVAFIIEAKHLYLRHQTIVSGNRKSSINDFSKVFGTESGLGQIIGTINNITNKKVDIEFINIEDLDEIYPIIVTSEFIPDDTFSRKFYDDEFIQSQYDSLNEQIIGKIKRPLVITIDELEAFQQIVIEKGEDYVVNFIRDRVAKISEKNEKGYYSIDVDSIWNTLSNQGEIYINTYLNKVFLQIEEKVKDLS